MKRILNSLAVGLMLSTAPQVWAQTTDTSDAASGQTDVGSALTQTELENLVAPIALYPDTLLIQVLVAATYPLEIVKADELVKANTELDQDAQQAAIDAQGYDESVAVLATAFPDVLADMAANLDWTDSIGTAMLANSDDVLTAVQTMRDAAINNGALTSGAEQTVSVDEGAIVVQPTDSQVVYVPEYDTQTVYVEDNSNDTLTNALIFFGSVALIDNIFDNNNNWNNYWGCRNCGGWGGRPIYANPRVNVGRNGNVNIGNDVNIGGGWKPEPKRQKDARNKISNHRGPDGKGRMPNNRPNTRGGDNRGNDMRQQLSKKTGAKDISRDRNNLSKADRQAASRPGSANRDGISRGGHSGAKAKAPVRKPAAKPKANRQPATRSKPKRSTSAAHQRAPASRSRSASSRGRSGGGGGGRGRR